MTCYSVIVLFFLVRTAYTSYIGPPVSPNENVSPNNPISNSQNTYHTNRSILETSYIPVNAQNEYQRKLENIIDQPSPVQLDYKMGPGLPIPNQATSPGIQNDKQMYPQANNRGLPRQASTIQHIVSNPYLKQIYKKSIPKKRYTIVHPNGTIEHTDEIHTVTARYPNYLMVKATDILANSDSNKIPTQPTKNTLSVPISNSITTINQTYNNSNEVSHKNQLTSNDFKSSGEQNSVIQSHLNTQSKTLLSKDVLTVISANTASINDPPIQQKVQEENKTASNTPLTENISKKEENKASNVLDSKNVAAANPVPIYSQTIPKQQLNYNKISESPTVNEENPSNPSRSVGDGSASDSDSTNYSNDVENDILAKNLTTSITPNIQESANVVNETMPVFLPPKTQSNLPEVATIEEHRQSEVIPEITTIEEPILLNNTKLNETSSLRKFNASSTIIGVNPPKDTPEGNSPVNNTLVDTNTTNTIEILRELEPEIKNNSTNTNVSEQPSSAVGNNSSTSWFYLSDEDIWDTIKKNATNVYFFFLPPQPKRFRETKTTIYPNGTSISEIIDTDVDIDEDGQPKMIRNATIIHS